MNILGITHILMLLIAYGIYIFVFIKFLGKQYPYRLLLIGNILYIAGFVLGMVWAQLEWGYPISGDSKILISALVPIPFIIETLARSKERMLPAIGCLLIALNYLIPYLLGTIHAH